MHPEVSRMMEMNLSVEVAQDIQRTSCAPNTQVQTLNSWKLGAHKSELSFGSRHRLACVEWKDVGMASLSGE